MKNQENKVDVSFKDVSEKIKSQNLFGYDLVVGIGEGGIVPASIIANEIGADLKIIWINYRDSLNNPIYNSPKILDKPEFKKKYKKVLLVDDVSVTGKTLETAKQQLSNLQITTLVMKGKADIVLFPDIKSCVNWLWK